MSESQAVSQTKICSLCGFEKPLDEFGRDAKGKYGKHAYCKECNRKKTAEWIKNNKCRADEQTKNWKSKNPHIAKQTRKRAIEKLTDWYVRELLLSRGIPKEQITPELIEMQRTKTTLKRLSKQIRQAATQLRNEE